MVFELVYDKKLDKFHAKDLDNYRHVLTFNNHSSAYISHEELDGVLERMKERGLTVLLCKSN